MAHLSPPRKWSRLRPTARPGRIALDTNVLVRYLVRDDERQAESARALLESLTSERSGHVCREVAVELVWVLERAYGVSRERIATILQELVATESLVVHIEYPASARPPTPNPPTPAPPMEIPP